MPVRKPYGRRLLDAVGPRGIRIVLALLSMLGLTGAEFYRYTDADGQVHYVDDPRHIPDSQLDSLKVYKEESLDAGLKDDDGPYGPGQGDAAAAAVVEGQDGDQAPNASDALESPVIVRGNRVLVPVEIAHLGRKVETNLLFDTGASFTILHQKVARKIMLTGTETREAVVVGGSRIPIRMAEVDYIQIGPYRITKAEVAIIRSQGPDMGHQGLLGMNILRNLDYTLDVNRSVIVWNE